jgi:WD40 repeat protein
VITYLLKTGQPIRRHRGAKGCVNSLDVTNSSRELIVTGGDDGKVRVWDVEEKEPVETIELGYPITAVAWSADGQQVFIAGLDNDVHVCTFRTILPFPSICTYSLSGRRTTSVQKRSRIRCAVIPIPLPHSPCLLMVPISSLSETTPRLVSGMSVRSRQ